MITNTTKYLILFLFVYAASNAMITPLKPDNNTAERIIKNCLFCFANCPKQEDISTHSIRKQEPTKYSFNINDCFYIYHDIVTYTLEEADAYFDKIWREQQIFGFINTLGKAFLITKREDHPIRTLCDSFEE